MTENTIYKVGGDWFDSAAEAYLFVSSHKLNCKPKEVRCFCCDICYVPFDSYEAAAKHEAEHYALSLDDYEEWERLVCSVVKSSYGAQRSRDGERVFELACDNLRAFEKEHNLVHKPRPKHFPQ